MAKIDCSQILPLMIAEYLRTGYKSQAVVMQKKALRGSHKDHICAGRLTRSLERKNIFEKVNNAFCGRLFCSIVQGFDLLHLKINLHGKARNISCRICRYFLITFLYSKKSLVITSWMRINLAYEICRGEISFF
jgi:hypothetical protein